MRTINRLNDLADVSKTSGRVLLDGINILDPSIDVISLRRRIGIVFARPVVLPLSIHDNLTYGLRMAGVRNKDHLRTAVERCLNQAALWEEVHDRLDEPASELSGGQQQRLCLARVLALEPDVILLDEPTSGLDPISTNKVEETLQELKLQYTIMLVPHSIQQGSRVADYTAFILQGELIEYSEGKTIFTNPKNKKTEDYITGRFG